MFLLCLVVIVVSCSVVLSRFRFRLLNQKGTCEKGEGGEGIQTLFLIFVSNQKFQMKVIFLFVFVTVCFCGLDFVLFCFVDSLFFGINRHLIRYG